MDYFDELNELFEGEDGHLFKPKPKMQVASSDDRLIESFREITEFVQKFDRLPSASADDLKEASLGTRLNSMRTSPKKVEVLQKFDELGLLKLDKAPETMDELIANYSDLFQNTEGLFDFAKLPRAKVIDKNVGDIAERKQVKDFELYKSLFAEKHAELQSGIYKLTKFKTVSEIVLHGFYIIDGIMCYVDKIGKAKEVFGRQKERLRVIFENGVESNMYLRTLSSQMYQKGYIVQDNQVESTEDNEDAVGRIYILKSLSNDPQITTIKDLYKIGVTTTSIEDRIKNAANDPTYLMAPVQLVDSFKLTGSYNPQKVEARIHKFLVDAQVVMEITDKNGLQYTPKEWYSVPLEVIREAVDLINENEIKNYHYNRAEEKITEN